MRLETPPDVLKTASTKVTKTFHFQLVENLSVRCVSGTT